jgi:Tfp pilus assembly protein PilX
MRVDAAQALFTGLFGHRRQRGQAIVLMALMIVALIGAVGLAIDIGNAAARQRQDQSAADAAALAAADRLSNGQSEGAAASAGTNVATLAGVPPGNLSIKFLDASRNPTTDPNSVIWVQAQVAEGVPTYFLRAIGIPTANVSALAEVKFPKKCALCFLDSSATPGLHISGNGGVNVTGGCAQVNSSANPALALDSSGNLNAPCTNVVGTVSQSSSGRVVPAAATGVAPVPDPLAGLPYPTPPITDYGNVFPGDTNTVINPGVYHQWALGGNGNLYLNPGTYVIVGPPSDSVAVSSNGGIKNCPNTPCPTGTLYPGGGTTTVQPGGVTLFFTCSAWPGAGTAAGPICPCPSTLGSNINVSSNGGLQITAPTSGTYQGVAIFFDRCNNGSIALTANGGVPVLGAIYAKASPLYLTANGPITVAGLVVTASADISANANLNVSYDPTNLAQKVNSAWLKWPIVRLVT